MATLSEALQALNIINLNTHLSNDSVSRGVANAVLFWPEGAATGGSFGRVTEATSVRDDTREDLKAPNTFVGGPQITLESTVTESVRGLDFQTMTQDDFTLGVFNGRQLNAAGAAATSYDLASTEVARGFLVRIMTGGEGRPVVFTVIPVANVTGTGITTDANPQLQFQARADLSANTYTPPAALNAAGGGARPGGILARVSWAAAAQVLQDIVASRESLATPEP